MKASELIKNLELGGYWGPPVAYLWVNRKWEHPRVTLCKPCIEYGHAYPPGDPKQVFHRDGGEDWECSACGRQPDED